MNILIGCDVDPVLPPMMGRPPGGNIWQCLDNLDRLIDATKGSLPPMTWLIRADESIRFSTGDFASGYTARQALWQTLAAQGHELGWHMHLMSLSASSGCFGFDSDPEWLPDAWRALSAHYPVRSTRTGWDYADAKLIRTLDDLGVVVDFSALPGRLIWHSVGGDRFVVDWSRCPRAPYHPDPNDYQRPGRLNLLEIPITQFRNSLFRTARSLAVRLANRARTLSGLRSRTRTLSDRWDSELIVEGPFLSLYFHPEDLAGDGLENFLRNMEWLRRLPNATFVTASTARQLVTRSKAANELH
jgi:hypothetical protein